MARMNNLPFERGGTYFGGDANAISATDAAHLEGKTYLVEDTVRNTGAYAVLRVLRHKGSNFTLSATNKWRGMEFGATAGWHGRKTRGLVAGLGAAGIPIDDAYSTGSQTNQVIKQNDLFYGVQEGPVRLRHSSAGTAGITIAATNLVCFTTNGKIQVAAAGRKTIGRPDTNVAGTGATNLTVLVHVGGLFADVY